MYNVTPCPNNSIKMFNCPTNLYPFVNINGWKVSNIVSSSYHRFSTFQVIIQPKTSFILRIQTINIQVIYLDVTTSNVTKHLKKKRDTQPIGMPSKPKTQCNFCDTLLCQEGQGDLISRQFEAGLLCKDFWAEREALPLDAGHMKALRWLTLFLWTRLNPPATCFING